MTIKERRQKLIDELQRINNDKDFDETMMFEHYLANDVLVEFEELLKHTVKAAKQRLRLQRTIDSISFFEEKYFG